MTCRPIMIIFLCDFIDFIYGLYSAQINFWSNSCASFFAKVDINNYVHKIHICQLLVRSINNYFSSENTDQT